MSNNNNSRDTNRRVRRRLYVPLNLTNYRKNVKNINITHHGNYYQSIYTNIPREIGSFTQLERLSLTGHKLTSLPKEIGNLKNLRVLDVSFCSLESLPKEIGNLKKLEILFLESNKITSLPKEIGLCKNLKRIQLDDNSMESLPKEIGNLKKLEKIHISSGIVPDQSLTSLPKEIGFCTNLKEIYLSQNKLTSIPKEIGLLKNLEDLGLDDNKLTSIPKEIGLCKNLKTLNFGDNKLTSIPKEIEDLPKLSKLNLRGNPGLKGISSELKKNGLNIWKNTNTKFINYKYYTNQLSTVTVKRKNLPRIPPKIRENIARKVNIKPKAKTEANKMNVARSSLKAYNNKQKVLTRRAENLISNRKQKLALAQKTLNNLNKINNNFKMTVSKVHNNASTKLIKKMVNTNNKNTKTRKLLSN